MKVTDYNEIYDAAISYLEDNGSDMLEYLSEHETATTITFIYLTGDLMAGLTQDWLGSISVISSPCRISIIYQNHASFYQHENCICLYEDLEGDIREIVTVLDAAIARWEDLNMQ